MFKEKQRLLRIKEAMDDIDFILHGVDFKITRAIEDRILKPVIGMNIIKVSEQFNKLKEENAFDVLSQFSDKDLRGLSAVRNFIAYDYDSVDDHIIEDVLRENFPILKETVENILSERSASKSI